VIFTLGTLTHVVSEIPSNAGSPRLSPDTLFAVDASAPDGSGQDIESRPQVSYLAQNHGVIDRGMLGDQDGEPWRRHNTRLSTRLVAGGAQQFEDDGDGTIWADPLSL